MAFPSDPLPPKKECCRTCSLHPIDYPAHMLRCVVDGCNIYTTFHDRPFDKDWREKVKLFNEEAPTPDDIPVTMPGADGEIPNLIFNPAAYEDRLWVPHDELLRAGYLNLDDFDVVQIKGKFYELQARIGRTLTHGIKGGAWWIEEIDANVTVPDYFPEGGTEDGKDSA